MEPFSITCTTCQARLRVHNAAAIGQILACPKCASMVMIPDPGGAAPEVPTAGPAQSESATSPTDGVAEDVKPTPGGVPSSKVDATGPAPSTAREPEERPARKFKFREDFSDPDEDISPKPIQDVSFSEPPPHGHHTDPQIDSTDDEYQSPSNARPAARRGHRLRQWIVLATAAVSGIALAVIVVGLLVSRNSNNPTPEPVDPSPTAEPTDPRSKPTQQIASTGPKGMMPSSSNVPKKMPPAKVGAPRKGDSETIDEPTEPQNTPTEPREGTKPPPDSNDSPPGLTPRTENPNSPDPNSPDPNSPDPNSPDPNSPDPNSPDPNSPDPNSPETTTPDSIDSPDPLDTAIHQPTIDMDAKLAVVVPTIEFSKITVIDFADFVSDFIAVPISLDLDAMLAANVSPDAEFEFQLRGVTVGQMLDAALEPIALSVVELEAGLLITTPTSSDKALRLATYDVTDLVKDSSQTGVLGSQLLSLVAPSTWSDVGGPGVLTTSERSLEVQQSDVVHFRITQFLDRLRAARGLNARSDLSSELIDVTPAFQRAASELNKPLPVHFTEPTSIARVLDYLRSQTDLRLLVDWRSCSQVGWWLTAKTTISGTDRPFYKQLDEWLGPQKLDYRLVDSATIEICSQAALAARPEVEIYRLANGSESDAAQLITQVKSELGEHFFSPDGGPERLFVDVSSGSLLVSLPAGLQRRLSDWLLTNGKLVKDRLP